MLVVKRLRELGVEALGVRTKTCSGEATELMDAWAGDDEVIIVDAVVTGASVGKVHGWDDAILFASSSASASTHGFGVGEAIKLAQALGRSPESLRIYGIEGRRFDRGSQVSRRVKQAVEDVAQQIHAAIRTLHSR